MSGTYTPDFRIAGTIRHSISKTNLALGNQAGGSATTTITVRHGEVSEVRLSLFARHSGLFGSKPPKNHPFQHYPQFKELVRPGFPYEKQITLVWKVEANGKSVTVYGRPREKKGLDKLPKHSKLKLDLSHGDGWIKVVARIIIDNKGIGIDIPWIEENGNLTIGESKQKSRTAEFLIKLLPKEAKEKPKPPPKLDTDLLSKVVYFQDEGQGNVGGKIGSALDNWVKDIRKRNERLFSVIHAGRVNLTLVGHASKTGSDKTNRELSQKRVDGVARHLSRGTNFGAKARFFKDPRGKKESLPGRRPSGNDRRVAVIIDKNQASSAIRKFPSN